MAEVTFVVSDSRSTGMGTHAKHWDLRVCMSVCLSVCLLANLKTTVHTSRSFLYM